MSSISEQLRQVHEEFEAKMLGIAREQFVEEVKPFCDLFKMDFFAGNGIWWFVDRTQSTDEPIHSEEFKVLYYDDVSRMINILETEVPGFPADSLGTLMPCYEDGAIRDN